MDELSHGRFVTLWGQNVTPWIGFKWPFVAVVVTLACDKPYSNGPNVARTKQCSNCCVDVLRGGRIVKAPSKVGLPLGKIFILSKLQNYGLRHILGAKNMPLNSTTFWEAVA